MTAPRVGRPGAVPGDRVTVESTAVTVETTVHAVVSRQLRLPPDDLTLDLDLVSDLGLDDAGAFTLLTAVEEALDARFPDDFLDGLQTYGDLATAVRISLGP